MKKTVFLAGLAVMKTVVFGMIPNNSDENFENNKRNFSQIREPGDGSNEEEQRRRRIRTSVPNEQQNQEQGISFQVTGIRLMAVPVYHVAGRFYSFYPFNYQTNQRISQPSQMRLPQQSIQRNPQVSAENARESAKTSRSAFYELNKEELEEMSSALRNGDIEIVKKFINKGMDINGYLGWGATPLTKAASCGHIDIVKYLVENGADINKADKNGDQTPLFLAIAGRHIEVVKYLIENGANIDKIDKKGKTALGLATIKLASTVEDEERKLYRSIIEYFVEKGAGVNTLSSGYTPLNLLIRGLHKAISKRVSRNQRRKLIEACENMIKYLLGHGANINGKNRRTDTYTRDSEAGNGETPLHLAAEYEFLDIVKCLVEHGARVNERGKFDATPLLNVTMPNFYNNSVTTERLNIIKYLIDKGADVNCYSERYGTPLSNISKSGSIDAIKCLLEHGANPNLGEYSPLISQIWRQYSKPEIVKLLLDYGASVNEADEKERTILMMASYKGYKDIVRMLVNIDSSLFEQYVISMILAGRNHTRMTDKDISKISTKIEGIPIRVNAKDKSGKTALVYVMDSLIGGQDINNTRYDIVKILLDSGANPNIKTKCGWTPLIYAASKNSEDIVRLLLEKGADLSGALNILNKSKSRRKGPLVEFLNTFVAPAE